MGGIVIAFGFGSPGAVIKRGANGINEPGNYGLMGGIRESKRSRGEFKCQDTAADRGGGGRAPLDRNCRLRSCSERYVCLRCCKSRSGPFCINRNALRETFMFSNGEQGSHCGRGTVGISLVGIRVMRVSVAPSGKIRLRGRLMTGCGLVRSNNALAGVVEKNENKDLKSNDGGPGTGPIVRLGVCKRFVGR